MGVQLRATLSQVSGVVRGSSGLMGFSGSLYLPLAFGLGLGYPLALGP